MFEALSEVLPLVIAAFVPPALAAIKKAVPIPSNLIPVLLPTFGGILSSLGTLVGVDVSPSAVSDPTLLTNAVTGILIGASAVGIHQIAKQRQKSE